MYTVSKRLIVSTLITVSITATASPPDPSCARLQSLSRAWVQQAYQLDAMGDQQNSMGDRMSSNVTKNMMWGRATNNYSHSSALMNQSAEAERYIKSGNCQEYLNTIEERNRQDNRQAEVQNRAKEVLRSFYQRYNNVPPPTPQNVSAIASQIGAQASDYPVIQGVLEASYRDFQILRGGR